MKNAAWNQGWTAMWPNRSGRLHCLRPLRLLSAIPRFFPDNGMQGVLETFPDQCGERDYLAESHRFIQPDRIAVRTCNRKADGGATEFDQSGESPAQQFISEMCPASGWQNTELRHMTGI